jgi:hypothetical protein
VAKMIPGNCANSDMMGIAALHLSYKLPLCPTS